MVKNKKTKAKNPPKKGKKQQKDDDYSSDESESVESYSQSSSSEEKDRKKKISKVQKTKKIKTVLPPTSSIFPPTSSLLPTLTAFSSPGLLTPFLFAPITPVLTTSAPVSDPDAILGYTAAQYQKFKSQSEKLSKWSNQKLKDCLKANFQSMSGNKQELVKKVADGIVLGRIPRCSSCFGGRPYFDYKLGIYTCKGFHDDTEMIECDKVYQLSQIKRDPWEF